MIMEFNAKQFRKDVITKRVLEIDLSVSELSEETGLSETRIQDIEKGNPINMHEFVSMCTFMKTTRPGKYFSKINEPEVDLLNVPEEGTDEKEIII